MCVWNIERERIETGGCFFFAMMLTGIDGAPGETTTITKGEKRGVPPLFTPLFCVFPAPFFWYFVSDELACSRHQIASRHGTGTDGQSRKKRGEKKSLIGPEMMCLHSFVPSSGFYFFLRDGPVWAFFGGPASRDAGQEFCRVQCWWW